MAVKSVVRSFYVCGTRVRRIILNFAEKGGRYGKYEGQVRQV